MRTVNLIVMTEKTVIRQCSTNYLVYSWAFCCLGSPKSKLPKHIDQGIWQSPAVAIWCALQFIVWDHLVSLWTP